MTPHFKTGYTVLVVDDDPAVLATYRRLLGRADRVLEKPVDVRTLRNVIHDLLLTTGRGRLSDPDKAEA